MPGCFNNSQEMRINRGRGKGGSPLNGRYWFLFLPSQFIKTWIGKNTEHHDKEGEKELWNDGENMIYFWTVEWDKRRKEEREYGMEAIQEHEGKGKVWWRDC